MVTNLHFNTHFLSFLHFNCIPYFLFCLFLFFTLLLPPRLILPCLSFPNFNSLFLVFSSLPFHVFALLLPPPLSFLSFLQFNSICSLISLLFLFPLPYSLISSSSSSLPCSLLSFLPPLLYSLISLFFPLISSSSLLSCLPSFLFTIPFIHSYNTIPSLVTS